MEENRLMSIEELAAYLGIATGTIYNGISRRAKRPFPVRAIRPCGRVKFDRREVVAWVDAGCPSAETWAKQR